MSNVLPDSTAPDAASGASTAAEERLLVERLRAGDEAAFELLLDRHHAAMVRLATIYVGSTAVAEEVAQETWLGVFQGIHRFEGRSSLKTWVFHILINRAKTRGVREGRSIPLSALGSDDAEPAVPPERFRPPDDPKWPGHWATPPQRWDDSPEGALLARETRKVIEEAIAGLPPSQAEVITLRDIQGWTGEEVCEAVGLTDANQRVLLHRARSKVRAALERYLSEVQG